jgi:hypothetical protein
VLQPVGRSAGSSTCLACVFFLSSLIETSGRACVQTLQAFCAAATTHSGSVRMRSRKCTKRTCSPILKEESVYCPKFHLGEHVRRKSSTTDTNAGFQFLSKYVQNVTRMYEYLTKRDDVNWNLPARAETSIELIAAQNMTYRQSCSRSTLDTMSLIVHR